ncbi:MAG: histidine phosphatase family protein [Alphaproteobacteria bacterium]|nr:histidine phosphatase family protein [Alphaproteobacteria bacterium]
MLSRRYLHLARHAWLAVALLVCGAPVPAIADDTALWTALRSGGHVALMRHALAPGTGDPSGFDLADCGTQRNLSDTGRAQAARIGARFRANGIAAARVLSSQWCRCRETATLLDLGPVEDLPTINSFFQSPERRDPQTRALKQWLAEQDLGGPVVLVTHQVNITALTGVFPDSGEIVIVHRSEIGELSVKGSIETD